MKVIGLCGRSGSGKGYVSEKFLSFGIPSIDTDAVYARIVSEENSPCLSELREAFGDGILKDGRLERRELAKIVFSSPDKLRKLNEITHKYIYEETVKLLEGLRENSVSYVLLDAPVLFESGFSRLCDITVCVICPAETSIERIVERDGISENKAAQRLKFQKTNEELISLCDYYIVNDGVKDVNRQIEKILKGAL